MKITRWGHTANFGAFETEAPALRIYWDPKDNALMVSARGVHDFDTPSRHDYLFSLSVKEVGSAIEALVDEAASSSAKEIAAGLSPHVVALLKLVGLCCWPGVVEQSAISGGSQSS